MRYKPEFFSEVFLGQERPPEKDGTWVKQCSLTFFVWILGLTLLCSSTTFAAGDLFERKSLHGLQSLQVVVENLPAHLVQSVQDGQTGLERETLKALIEEQLLQAGVAIEPQVEHALYINLKTTLNDTGSYSYVLSYEFLQLVLLFRAPETVTWGSTWSYNQVGTLPPSELDHLETLISHGVAVFIDDYYAANKAAYQPTAAPLP